MYRFLHWLLLVVSVASILACGTPEVRRDGPSTRDRANESFQDLEREESTHKSQ